MLCRDSHLQPVSSRTTPGNKGTPTKEELSKTTPGNKGSKGTKESVCHGIMRERL